MTKQRLPLRPYPLGARREAEGARFAFVSGKENCGVILYDRETGRKLRSVPFSEEERIGNVHCGYLEKLDFSSISYQFYEDDKIVPDNYARGFAGGHVYGRPRKESSLKAVFNGEEFDWEEDVRPGIAYTDCICCCIHVRGFTRHPSSGVFSKGTFQGLAQKAEYLKESGFTTIELQPAYEFLELEEPEEKEKVPLYPGCEDHTPRLNYWGYKKGFYYAPKAAYAAGKDVSAEFKGMVKVFHKNQMEVVMQFYFPNEVSRRDIADILRFWVLEYHVDGFHLLGEKLPVELIAEDPVLADTKIWYESFGAGERLKGEGGNLAAYRDDYMYVMRRFLKGDEDMLSGAIYQMRHIPEGMGRIHFMTNYYGMTLADMVAYNHKHNEANGEDNRDGNNYNCSWNCGEEGNTRKKRVRELRLKQMKNALCMLMFSQSTPLLFMGDEFGNSQKGNNNPYCQDNSVTWLNWNDLERNRELYSFWRRLVLLRREHPILHPAGQLRAMDYLSLGYPDLSYHGKSAWKPQLESYNRHIGIMYCGRYARTKEGGEDDFLYLAVNMHWEEQELAMPKLPRGLEWELVCATALEYEGKESAQDVCRRIPPRSIAVFKSTATGK